MHNKLITFLNTTVDSVTLYFKLTTIDVLTPPPPFLIAVLISLLFNY